MIPLNDIGALTNFRKVLLRLRVSYYAAAKTWPFLQEFYARKIADVEAALTAVNKRLGRDNSYTTPGGNDET